MSELAVIEDTPNAQLSETGLSLPDNLSHEEWVDIGRKLGRAHKASAWWIGDWINYGEDAGYVSREKYEEAIQITQLKPSTLWEYAMVSRRFRESLDRSKDLDFTHHARAARISDPNERRRVISAAAREGWTTRQIDECVNATAPTARTNIQPSRRHAAMVDAAYAVARISDRWESSMTDALTPPEARKQLTILRKAEAALAEVIEAVEYRAATLHEFNH